MQEDYMLQDDIATVKMNIKSSTEERSRISKLPLAQMSGLPLE